ncbi:MAG: hypothetical protein QMD22_07640 [archaeon]|nr:hypothetical protein [archaeon]
MKEKDESKPPMLPEEAVSLAWALTLSYSRFLREGDKNKSEEQSERTKLPQEIDGEKIRTSMEQFKNSYQGGERQFLEQLYISIWYAVRDLIAVRNGRDLNFDQCDRLRKVQLDAIEGYTTFSLKAQSLIPRLFGIGVSGITFGELTWGQGITKLTSSPTFQFGLIVGIPVLLYVCLEVIMRVPLVWLKQIELIRNDYDRDVYYDHYLWKSADVLRELAYNALRLCAIYYPDIYYYEIGENQNMGSLKDPLCEAAEKIVPKPIIKRCDKLDKCYHLDLRVLKRRRITTNRWSMCKSGVWTECCPFKDKEGT